MGGHLLRYPWSAILDWAWYWNFDSGLKRAESDIISDIGINFYPISDIQRFIDQHSGWEVRRWPVKIKDLGSKPADVKNIFWISDIGMATDVDIRTLPISEWQFAVRHIFFRYRNDGCRCRISPILLRKINVDAHLWVYLVVYSRLLEDLPPVISVHIKHSA